jgi:hypothetical protein
MNRNIWNAVSLCDVELGRRPTLREAKERVWATDMESGTGHFDSNKEEGYTIVEFGVRLGGVLYHGRGYAYCNPGDEWHWTRGMEIAIGRASVDIARQYMREGWIGLMPSAPGTPMSMREWVSGPRDDWRRQINAAAETARCLRGLADLPEEADDARA